MEEVPFSQLIQHSRDTLEKLDQSRGRLRLVRRDGEDLILESARRAEADDEVIGNVGRIIRVLADVDKTTLYRAFPDVFEWMRFLPDDEARAFIADWTETAAACSALGNYAPLVAMVAAWHATAEVYADPAVLAVLSTPHDEADYGSVPEPGAG